jgi:hypothetical protein
MLPGGEDGVDRPEMLYPAGCSSATAVCLLCNGYVHSLLYETLEMQLPASLIASRNPAAGRVLWLIPQDEPAVVADEAAADAAAEEVCCCSCETISLTTLHLLTAAVLSCECRFHGAHASQSRSSV